MLTDKAIETARQQFQLDSAEYPDDMFRTLGDYAIASDYPGRADVIASGFAELEKQKAAITCGEVAVLNTITTTISENDLSTTELSLVSAA